MKKKYIHIALFLSSTILVVFVLLNSVAFFADDNINKDNNYLALNSPNVERKIDFINSASSLIGKEIIINGNIKVAYKNKNNELVLIVNDDNIPFEINCTLINSNKQIKQALKLDENIILTGKFTELDEFVNLENCLIIKRLEVIDNIKNTKPLK